VGAILNALTAFGYVLAAMGVTTAPVPWVAAIGIGIGTAAFLVVIVDYHLSLEAKLTPHKLANKINRMLLYKRGLDRQYENLDRSDAEAVVAWQTDGGFG